MFNGSTTETVQDGIRHEVLNGIVTTMSPTHWNFFLSRNLAWLGRMLYDFNPKTRKQPLHIASRQRGMSIVDLILYCHITMDIISHTVEPQIVMHMQQRDQDVMDV